WRRAGPPSQRRRRRPRRRRPPQTRSASRFTAAARRRLGRIRALLVAWRALLHAMPASPAYLRDGWAAPAELRATPTGSRARPLGRRRRDRQALSSAISPDIRSSTAGDCRRGFAMYTRVAAHAMSWASLLSDVSTTVGSTRGVKRPDLV